jgi:hypothetical protein
MSEFNLWPFPSWIAMAGGIAIMIGTYWAARRGVRRRNRALAALAPELHAAGLVRDAGAFSVTGGRSLLLAAAGHFAVLDPRRGFIVQTMDLDAVRGFKIHERKKEDIEFRLILRNRAESRLISTRSIADFSRLFQMLAKAGKPLEYIQEEAR